jgi:hypothetical protein
MPAPLKPISFFLQDRTKDEGFTQSELSLMDECAKKWNLRYNNLLTRAGEFAWPHYIGGAWHKFQELWRVTKGEYDLDKAIFPIIPKGIDRSGDFDKWIEYWNAVMPAYQREYAKMYPEEAKHEWEVIEEEIDTEFLGYRLRGKIDLASAKPKFIRDFKTTVSAWLISPNGWHFKLQFMFYCWLMAKTKKNWHKTQFQFQQDIMQKPGLKQTKADVTWAGHIRRVVGDVKERPEFYLTRGSALITPEAIARFEHEVLTPKIQRIALAYDNPNEAVSILSNPNTNACNAFGNQCEFFEICEKGFDAGKFLFMHRDTKHSELGEAAA